MAPAISEVLLVLLTRMMLGWDFRRELASVIPSLFLWVVPPLVRMERRAQDLAIQRYLCTQ